jgi:hypothetical protein
VTVTSISGDSSDEQAARIRIASKAVVRIFKMARPLRMIIQRVRGPCSGCFRIRDGLSLESG